MVCKSVWQQHQDQCGRRTVYEISQGDESHTSVGQEGQDRNFGAGRVKYIDLDSMKYIIFIK